MKKITTRKMKKIKKNLRTWHYLYQPKFYEVHCNSGGKINEKHRTTWSEFESEIWCYDCKKDMKGFEGIFGGPIPWQCSKMIMGKYCFYRYNVIRKCVEMPRVIRGSLYYCRDNFLTKKIRALRAL